MKLRNYIVGNFQFQKNDLKNNCKEIVKFGKQTDFTNETYESACLYNAD